MFPPSLQIFDIRPHQSGASVDVVSSLMANAIRSRRTSWDAFPWGRVNQLSRLPGSALGRPRWVAERVYDRPPECNLTILPSNHQGAARRQSAGEIGETRLVERYTAGVMKLAWANQTVGEVLEIGRLNRMTKICPGDDAALQLLSNQA